MKQKTSDRQRQVRKSMQFRLLTLEALIASKLPALLCPEAVPNRMNDGAIVRCEKPVTTIIELDDDMLLYTCHRCSQFYVGTRRNIDATDRIRIAAELMWESEGDNASDDF